MRICFDWSTWLTRIAQAVMFHFGSNRHEMDMEDIDMITQGQPSTLGTGGGTGP